MKTGIMIVGLCGVNASTLISGCIAMQHGLIKKQYGITELDIFDQMNLLDVDNLVFSGWDYRNRNQYDLMLEYGIVSIDSDACFEKDLKEIVPYKGIRTDLDIEIESDFDNLAESTTVDNAIYSLQSNIADFQRRNSLDSIVVIYLGSPSRTVDDSKKHLDYAALCRTPIDEIPSSICYAIAAISSGAHFIDFTPSETLDFDLLENMAQDYGVQLSGRDGSTGQTMLKLAIGNMLKIRNLRVLSWYSNNILGNHDGYILSKPEYSQTKIADKKLGLEMLLGYSDFEHKITIDFVKRRFDNKESWDVIDFCGWLGTEMSLRINWQGEDAILSAPILLDIIRLIDFGARSALKGFQKQLGLFYKHPYFCEEYSLEQLFEQMIAFYNNKIE